MDKLAPDDHEFDRAVSYWQDLKSDGRHGEAAEHYFDNILSTVVENLSRQYQDKVSGRCRTLFSSLGFSPELTIMMAAVFRPERLYIVYSENAEGHYSRCYRYLTERMDWKLEPHQFRQILVDPFSPDSVYEEVRRRVVRENASETIFDATGGTRIMTGICIQLAWEAGASVYYSFGKYDPDLKQPIPGTEHIAELPNPSIRIGVDRRQAAIALYELRNFRAAAGAFLDSAKWNRDHLFEDFSSTLCELYGDWKDLNLASMKRQTERIDHLRDQPLLKLAFDKVPQLRSFLDSHVDTYRSAADGDAFALIASYLELASMYRSQHRHDFSGLFSYRCMEACIHLGLQNVAQQRQTHFDPNRARNQYHNICDDVAEFEQRYRDLSDAAGFGRNVTLPGRVHLLDGLGVLCLVTETTDEPIYRRIRNCASPVEVIELVKPVADLRNKSAMIHGSGTLNSEDSEKLLQFAEEIAAAVLQSEFEKIRTLRDRLRPVDLNAFAKIL